MLRQLLYLERRQKNNEITVHIAKRKHEWHEVIIGRIFYHDKGSIPISV